MLNGWLFHYAPGLTAFCTQLSGSTHSAVILIGGLGDGYLSLPYTTALAKAIAPVALIMPLLRSSYSNYGQCTIDMDVDDLQKLGDALLKEGFTTWTVIGHSTGAQDALHWLKHVYQISHPFIKSFKSIILQGAVSDRLYLTLRYWTNDEPVNEWLSLAQEMIQNGQPFSFLPNVQLFNNTPVTAQRFHDLVAVNGRDDYFSNDLTDTDLIQRYSNLPTFVPICFCHSEWDEYFVCDSESSTLAFHQWIHRLKRLLPQWHLSHLIIPAADHALGSPPEASLQFIDLVVQHVHKSKSFTHAVEESISVAETETLSHITTQQHPDPFGSSRPV